MSAEGGKPIGNDHDNTSDISSSSRRSFNGSVGGASAAVPPMIPMRPSTSANNSATNSPALAPQSSNTLAVPVIPVAAYEAPSLSPLPAPASGRHSRTSSGQYPTIHADNASPSPSPATSYSSAPVAVATPFESKEQAVPAPETPAPAKPLFNNTLMNTPRTPPHLQQSAGVAAVEMQSAAHRIHYDNGAAPSVASFPGHHVQGSISFPAGYPMPVGGEIHKSPVEEVQDEVFLHGWNEAAVSGFDHTVCREYVGQRHFQPIPDYIYWSPDAPLMGTPKSHALSPKPMELELPQDQQRIPQPMNLHKKPGSQVQPPHMMTTASGRALPDFNIPVGEVKTLAVLIPFYNEEWENLQITLASIWLDSQALADLGFEMHVLLVMDGWWKASTSMQREMKRLFPHNSVTPTWWHAIKPIPKDAKLSDCVSTFVVQRHAPGGKTLAPIDIGGGRRLKISLLVKRDNRRKINAHDWMLASFAKYYKAHFVFLTDCGTLFEKDCVALLTKELSDRPHCTAVTGRQRVMSARQQNQSEMIGGPAWWYRSAQLFDYESCLASFTGAFSLFGMLPVVPGPCGLYRFDAIRDDAVPFYINTVASHPAECGLLQANLNLAEDRVLSYAAVMRTHNRAYTAYVPEATFYFEAETKPLMLFTQRRRWINGTVAGYIWLLTNPSIIWMSNLRCWNKPFLTLLLLCQVFMYMAVAVAPAIFTISFRWTLPWAQTYFLPGYDRTFADNHIHDIIIGAYGLLYVIFVCVHARPAQKPAVVSWLVHFVGFINALVMILIMGSMAVALYDNYLSTGFDLSSNGAQNWITVMVIFSIVGPLLLALVHSPLSFLYMLKSFIQFYLLLPTMVVWIGAYAMSRVWDLSWGNRPSEQSSLAGKLSQADRDHNSAMIQFKGRAIGYGIMLLNVIATAAVLIWSQQSDFVVGLALFIFTWVVIQMAFSLIYFIFRLIRRAKRAICFCFCVKCCRCHSEKQWYDRNAKAHRKASAT